MLQEQRINEEIQREKEIQDEKKKITGEGRGKVSFSPQVNRRPHHRQGDNN